jgi:uncharacterized protein YndB with AHSA1/START domain
MGNFVPDELDRESAAFHFTVNVSDERMYSWHSQAAQYPPSGPAGIAYFRGELGGDLFVDCLLYRDESGELIGILNRYPSNLPPHEREGDQNIWVRPDRRRQGIGSALVTEAFFRWGPSPNSDDLRLTESGARLLQGMEEKRSIVRRVLPCPPEVVYEKWLNAEDMFEWICARPAVPTRIEIVPEVDGRYQIEIDDDGLARVVTGRYLILNEPDGLVFTWHCSTWDPSSAESVVMVQLEPHGTGRTLMTLRHGRLPAELRHEYEIRWGRVARQLEAQLEKG